MCEIQDLNLEVNYVSLNVMSTYTCYWSVAIDLTTLDDVGYRGQPGSYVE